MNVNLSLIIYQFVYSLTIRLYISGNFVLNNRRSSENPSIGGKKIIYFSIPRFNLCSLLGQIAIAIAIIIFILLILAIIIIHEK